MGGGLRDWLQRGPDRECEELKIWGAAQGLIAKGVPGWRWNATA